MKEDILVEIRKDIAENFYKGGNSFRIKVNENDVEIIYSENVIINNYLHYIEVRNDISGSKIVFGITKTTKEIFEDKIEEFKKRAIARARKCKFIKDKLLDFRLADMKDIDYNDSILKYDIWGFDRNLILRAYIVVKFEIDKKAILLNQL